MSHCIEWRHDGRRIILPVIILPPAPTADLSGFEAQALLDTGSTTSAITPRVAQRLSLTKRGKRPLASAQGEGQAERYLFRVGLRLAADGPAFPYVFEGVSGFELTDAFSLDALLGMDVLRHCDFTMHSSGRCTLGFG